MVADTLRSFLEAMSEDLGYPALSEAKMLAIAEPANSVLIAEDDRILAVGAVATHRQSNGSLHRTIETAVDRSMRFPEFEVAVLEETLRLAGRESVSVWSRRPTLDAALTSTGFVARRSLLHMSTALPVEAGSTLFEALRPGDEEQLVSVNNEAFALHREAGNLTREMFEALTSEPWFDRQGVMSAYDGDRLVGFCWTKAHPNGDGEIYRVAVHPPAQGRGVGRALVLSGFGHLADRPDVRRGTLWVDEENTGAVELYRSIGMKVDGVNREFEPGT